MDVDRHSSPPAVTLEIDGVGWAKVATLADASPKDRHYTADVDPVTGATLIRFGDGATGQRPPIGMALVHAVYRSSAGSAGNAPGDSVNPLRALLMSIREQVELLEGDVSRLYDDWFVETAHEWPIPYLGPDGDVLGEWTLSRRGHRMCLCLELVRGPQLEA
jgi:hypothetical protein